MFEGILYGRDATTLVCVMTSVIFALSAPASSIISNTARSGFNEYTNSGPCQRQKNSGRQWEKTWKRLKIKQNLLDMLRSYVILGFELVLCGHGISRALLSQNIFFKWLFYTTALDIKTQTFRNISCPLCAIWCDRSKTTHQSSDYRQVTNVNERSLKKRAMLLRF